MLGRAPGAVAIDNHGRLCGYLIGYIVPSLKSTQRGAYVPEYGHAVAAGHPERPYVYKLMYAAMSRRWAANGCYSQAITILADDRPSIQAWFESGFGMLVTDSLRSLDPVVRKGGHDEGMKGEAADEAVDFEIHQATPADAGKIVPLFWELERYMAGAPIFLPVLKWDSEAEVAEKLANPETVLLYAVHQGEPVALLRYVQSTDNACHIITDPKTASINGAYTRPSLRGRDIATALLGRLIDIARARGYERCSVDFESQNIYGSRFWHRHFQPVAHSLLRRIDERVGWAGEHREREGSV